MMLVAAILVASLETRTVRVGDVLRAAPAPLRSIAIARLPAGSRAMTLSRNALAALIRHRLPGMRTDGLQDVRLLLAPHPATRTPYHAPTPAIERGAELVVSAAAGPVRVSRRVTAMQRGEAGRALFVRDQDGQVYAARISQVQR